VNWPSILLLHADQHRWDCLGSYGNPDARTPHLDKLGSKRVAVLRAKDAE
jgi:hypothetical protein